VIRQSRSLWSCDINDYGGIFGDRSDLSDAEDSCTNKEAGEDEDADGEFDPDYVPCKSAAPSKFSMI
jgi:hypothetical protein